MCIMFVETTVQRIQGHQWSMSATSNTLGRFVSELMRRRQHNNSSLAAVAGVSESVIRNLLKHGIDPRAKDPDPRTLRSVADALDVDPLMLFRLAGYIAPAATANSVRAEYLADVFDQLPLEKQDTVMSVLEAMTEQLKTKTTLQEMRRTAHDSLAGLDLSFPAMLREAANQLIVRYAMTTSADMERIAPETEVLRNKWSDLPKETRERIRALIRHKLSLEYDPTMVDENWRN